MRLQPPPPAFERVYIEGGWRLAEQVFGVRPAVMNRWKHYVGRDRIEAERTAFMTERTAQRTAVRNNQNKEI